MKDDKKFAEQGVHLRNCVACGSSKLSLILDLGTQPLANDFLDHSNFEKFPLSIYACSNCAHTQLDFAVNPNRLFRHYLYVSGTTKTLKSYFETFVTKCSRMNLPNNKILEIASNDGSLLKIFNDRGWESIGVDPALNLVTLSTDNGVTTIPSYFNKKLAHVLANDFGLIVAMNVFAHTSDPLEILETMVKIIGEDGLIMIQTSQANMFERNEFDTAYHEHISFFNVRSMKALIERSGLNLIGLEIVPIHGDSYLWFVSKKKVTIPQTKLLREREEFENEIGMFDGSLYFKLEENAKVLKNEICEILEKYRNRGYRIASYGAAAKGNTFLNYAGISLDYIFDDSNHKIGKFAPAGGQIVSDPKILSGLNGKLLILIPAWNFKEEILMKIRELITQAQYESIEYMLYYPKLETGEINV
jgi:2-polyprenyl-3-methyl-5-hydroxy-6-metoxy-1,4-benzoquinol methylase